MDRAIVVFLDLSEACPVLAHSNPFEQKEVTGTSILSFLYHVTQFLSSQCTLAIFHFHFHFLLLLSIIHVGLGQFSDTFLFIHYTSIHAYFSSSLQLGFFISVGVVMLCVVDAFDPRDSYLHWSSHCGEVDKDERYLLSKKIYFYKHLYLPNACFVSVQASHLKSRVLRA